MTRAEFDAGWHSLKGAGMPTSAELDANTYFGALAEIEATLWLRTVKRAVRECNFFPTPFMLREFSAAIMRDEFKAKNERRAVVMDGPPCPTGHPACPKRPDEGFLEYLERLGMYLYGAPGTTPVGELRQVARQDAVEAPGGSIGARDMEEPTARLPYAQDVE